MNPLPLNDIKDRHLGRILQLQAQQNGDTAFLINDEQRITYREAEDITNRLAAGFRSLGVAEGDRVSLFMGNVPELVLACLALNKIGAVIEKKFSASQFMDRVKQFNATQTFAVGSMGIFLATTPAREDDADTPLREAQIVPMPPDLWEAFEKRFDLTLLASGMGQSECLLTLNQIHSDVEVPTYALGFAPPDADVRLFDDDGNEVPDGQAGEICVRPLEPYILFNGYFDDPEATAAAYRGEWFLTGDMARKDPETGAFFFVDRKKDAVRFAGRNISTMEVESVLLRHPGVAQVAAFGIPSPDLQSEGELMLSIVLDKGADASAEDICKFLNDNAPHYFVPRYIDFVDALPYTPTNKVQTFKLREQGISDATWDLRRSDYVVRK